MSEETKLTTKKLNKKLLIGAVAIIAIALVAALAIFLPKSAEAKKLNESLNLGDKYLSELNYEQAAVAYLAVIEIDPKNVDALIGLVDAYIAQGEYDKAVGVLEDALDNLSGDAAAAITEKLDKIRAEEKGAEVTPIMPPTAVPTEVPIVENTPTPAPTSTPVPTATSTPTPTPLPFETGNFKWRYKEDGTVKIVGVIDKSVTELIIPESLDGAPVTELAGVAFSSCTKIKELHIPEGITTIGNWLLRDCRELTSVKLPASLKEIGEGIFQRCSALEEIMVAEGNEYFTVINGALYSKDLKVLYCLPKQRILEKFVVENGTERIAEYALYECQVKEVVLPETVVSIEKYAFCQSDTIEKINLPDSITSVGIWAFANCDKISGFSMPVSLQEIGEMAFYRCAMERVVLPAGVTIIGEGAFVACDNLTEIVVAKGNTKYKSVNGVLYDTDMKTLFAFPSGSTRRTFEIPYGVENISKYAFDGCMLTDLNIPDSVVRIGDHAFWNCHAMGVLRLPKSVVELGETIVLMGIHRIEFAAENPVFKNIDNYVLSKDGTKLIFVCRKKDGSEPFYNLPDGIKIVGERAFQAAHNAKEIILPNSIEEIQDSAFFNCDFLEKVYIPASVTVIADEIFTNSPKVVIYTPVGSYAEQYAKEHNIPVINGEITAEVTPMPVPTATPKPTATPTATPSPIPTPKPIASKEFPAPVIVKETSGDLFMWNENADGTLTITGIRERQVTEIGIPAMINGKRVTAIGNQAFANCTYLEYVTIPDSVLVLGNWLFQGCSNLKEVCIPEGVTEVPNMMFSSCTSLERLYIPAGVKQIGYWNADSYNHRFDFIDSKVFEGYIVDEENEVFTSVNGSLFSKDMSTLIKVPFAYVGSFIIPEQVEEIPGGTFENCKYITEIVIKGNKLDIIHATNDTFVGCDSLERFIVEDGSSNLATLDGMLVRARDCALLVVPNKATGKDFRIPDAITEITSGAFDSCIEMETVYIPASVSAKKTNNHTHNGFLYATDEENYFEKCASLKEIIVDSTSTEYKSVDGVLFTADGTTLVGMPCNYPATSYSIPSGVVNIGSYAMNNCTNINKITCPDSLVSICPWALQGCISLSEITLPSSLRYIGVIAFGSCTALNELVIPEGVKEIHDFPFSSCTNMKTLTVPASVTVIGSNGLSTYGKTTIIAPAGSYAEQYARENNLTVVNP